QDPNRFLSAVQVGVTVATLVSGAFGAATLAAAMRSALIKDGVSAGWASVLSFVTVTVAISYLSLVLQELAPKRLALQRPESVALVAAPLLDRVSVLARPLVWLLSQSTNLVVRLLGGDPSLGRDVMTTEELQDLVVEHQALPADERRIVADVFDAGRRQLREGLLRRTEVEFIAADPPLAVAAASASKASHSRFPVYQESYDDVIGFVHLRDLLDPNMAGKALVVGEVVRPVERLPISKRGLPALSEMRRDRAHLAVVGDEYGGPPGLGAPGGLGGGVAGGIRGGEHRGRVRGRGQRAQAGRGPGGGGRPAEPGRVRRADRGRPAGGPVRDGGRVRARSARPVAGRRGRRRGGRAPADRDRDGRPPHRAGTGRPGGTGHGRRPRHRSRPGDWARHTACVTRC